MSNICHLPIEQFSHLSFGQFQDNRVYKFAIFYFSHVARSKVFASDAVKQLETLCGLVEGMLTVNAS